MLKIYEAFNKWCHEMLTPKMSVVNIDCMTFKWKGGDNYSMRIIENKHNNEPDRKQQDLMLHKLAEELKHSHIEVVKIRGDEPYDNITVYDYKDKVTKRIVGQQNVINYLEFKSHICVDK